MTTFSLTTSYTVIGVFCLVSFVLAAVFAKKRNSSTDNFLFAERNLGWKKASPSIAASWLWAVALFVSVELAYTYGIAGVFWFVIPNVLALLSFVILGPRIRTQISNGSTLPNFMYVRTGSVLVHKIYVATYLFYQLMAVTVQVYAGGMLVSALTGLALTTIMPVLVLISLSYTLVSGFEGSVITDVAQYVLLLIACAIILPLTWNAAGGFAAIISGWQGVSNVTHMFDSHVAFSIGITTSIGLLAGALSDQQYWQRVFAIKKEDVRKSFVAGACLFGIIPLGLSSLGLIAANPSIGIALPSGIDRSMIGVTTVMQLLPTGIVILFVLMLLAGLASTLDSALSATSTLWVTDMKKSTGKNGVKDARHSMFGVTLLGLVLALAIEYTPNIGLFHLWWVFNTIAACIVVPTILSLYWSKLSGRGVSLGVALGMCIGLPLFIYANVVGSDVGVVMIPLGILIVSGLSCIALPKQ